MNKQIKAYISDMDGTLVDNCAYHVKAWRKFSKKYGHELTEREILDWMGAQGGYYIERIMGRPLPKEEVGLFISPNAALPDEDRYRENFKVKERVYKYGFGAKEHVEIPIVPRGIYHNNPGLLAPLDDSPELKRAKTGDLVAEKLRIQDVRELSARAANKPAKPKSFTPKTFKPKKCPNALSFFDKVRKHRIEFFKKNGK